MAEHAYTIRGNGELREWTQNNDGTLSHDRIVGNIRVNNSRHNQFRSAHIVGFQRHLITTCNIDGSGFSFVRVNLSNPGSSTRIGSGTISGKNIFGLTKRIVNGVEEVYGIIDNPVSLIRVNFNSDFTSVSLTNTGQIGTQHAQSVGNDGSHFYYVNDDNHSLYRGLPGETFVNVGEFSGNVNNFRGMDWDGENLYTVYNGSRYLRIDRTTPANSTLAQTLTPNPNAHGFAFALAPRQPTVSTTNTHDQIVVNLSNTDPAALSHTFRLLNSTGSQVLVDVPDSTATTHTFGSLNADTQYIVSVEAVGEFGESGFTTNIIRTDQLGPANPVWSASNITQTSFTVNITAASDAVSYDVIVINPDGTPSPNSIFRGTDLSYTFSNLIANSDYETRVKAYDANGNSSDNVTMTITTLMEDPGISFDVDGTLGFNTGTTNLKEIYVGNQRLTKIYKNGNIIHEV